MNCNDRSTNNSSNNGVPVVKGVYGNVLRLAIPLTKRVVTMENDEVVATDTNFTPSSDYPVTVQFVKDAIKIDMPATMMNGYIAFVEDKGTLPVGTFALVVLCKDDEGNPYRFKQRTVVRIYDVTADANIQQPIEFESRVWYLDAAIFMALKGEDGVGIAETIIEQSDEVGGYNYITFVMTDGTSRTFSVMNGSGSVDTVFSTTSQHPLANSVVTQRFNTVEQSISDANGDISDLQENAVCSVEYDATTNHLIGHTLDAENESQPRFSIDFSEFLKNYFIDDAFIENGLLKLRYNAEANKPDLSVNLNEHINPSDYVTELDALTRFVVKDELNNYLRLNAAGKINYAHSPFIILTSLDFQYNGNPTASLINNAYYCTDGYVRYFYSDGNSINSIRATPVSGILYCLKSTGDLYRWDAPTRTFILTNRHFDSQNYHTKSQVNSLLQGYAERDAITGNLKYNQMPHLSLDFIDGLDEDAPTPTIGIGTLYGTSDGNIALTIESWDDVHIVGSAIDLIFYNKNTEALYTYKQGWIGEESGWVKISSSSGGSVTQVQADWNESDTTDPAYIQNKPTIPTVPITSIKMNGSTVSPSSGEVNLGTVITSHQDISGKADKSEMSITAGTGNDADKTTIQLKSGTSATVLTQHQDISGKQDVLVASENIKLIGGESPLGVGNIDVSKIKLCKVNFGDRVAVYPATRYLLGQWTFGEEPLSTLYTNTLYVDVLTNKSYIYYAFELHEVGGVTVDTSITNNGANPVTGGAIYTALQGKLGVNDVSVSTPSTPDGTVVITVGSNSYVINLNHTHSQYLTSSDVDSSITNNGTNPVTGGAIYTALAGKLSASDISVATPSTPNGTVVITVGSNTYTIDFNHTHTEYAAKKTVVSNTDSTVTLSADVIYNLGTVSGNKTINLPTTVDSAAEYEFRLAYTSGTITLPSGVSVANDATLTFTAGKTYQVVICGGILYFSETTVSARAGQDYR